MSVETATAVDESSAKIKIIECPRDAMQGWPHFIPTNKKIEYLQQLLRAGFDTIDFGSFVSPKAIPQMADTQPVLDSIDPGNFDTKLLAIIANVKGAEQAVKSEKITYLGFPFSVSETFQQRNTNSSVDEGLERVEAIQNLCVKNNKELVVYMSMGFGNPYGDVYNADLVISRMKQIAALGINIISVADTIGAATAAAVRTLMGTVMPEFKNIEVGVHLHSTPAEREEKIEAAFAAGCRRFDSAIRGIGGCPMAGNDLVGNMDTEVMINYLLKKGHRVNTDLHALKKCSDMASEIFI